MKNPKIILNLILLIFTIVGFSGLLYLGSAFPVDLISSKGDNSFANNGDPNYNITQITDNNRQEYRVKVHNGLVVWEGYQAITGDEHIYLYDSFTGITSQLSTGSQQIREPDIHNGLVVWRTHTWYDLSRVWVYNHSTGITTRILSSKKWDFWDTKIHNGQVTCVGNGGSPEWNEIWFYDCKKGIPTRVTYTHGYEDWWPKIHNGLVTWQAGGRHGQSRGWEVFLYNSSTGQITQVTKNSVDDQVPKIHDGIVAWRQYDENDYEIMMYDSDKNITTQITDNDYDDGGHWIHNRLLTWCGYDGNDYEIFFYDLNTGITTQVTDNNYDDRGTTHHNGQIVWNQYDGFDYEIMIYDLNTGIMTQITENDYDDYVTSIHNGQITWVRWDGNDYDIFLATPTMDSTPPVITIDYKLGERTDGNPGKWNIIADDDESGINEDTITVLIDGEFAGDILGDYDVPNTLGEHTIYVEVENNDGYLGFESDSVTIIDDDTSYPEMIYIYTGDGTDGNPGEVIVTASDDSGLSVDPSGAYPVPNSLGTHNFMFTATDNDNDRVDDALTRTVEITIDIIDDDSAPPEILIDYTGSGLDSDPGYFEWNVFDLDSGISEINITISYESTEGSDDYVINLEGTEAGTWNLPPNLGVYTLEISVRDNDNDRTLIVDSLTTELTRDQDILDDDVVSPELSNLILIPSIFEINISFTAIDESGIGDISTFINGELIEPITQIQYGNTYSFIFENKWLFQSGVSEVVIQVEDGDDDRPNDVLTSFITGAFENVLYPTYEYIIWQLEELKNYIDENSCPHVVRSLNRKLTQAQDHLYEAFNYFEDGSITCALFHDYLAKLFIRFAEHRTEIFNRKGLIEDYHAEYIIDSLHEIRNNIVLLMGASTGEEQAYEIALIEVELLNLKDFIEDEIPCCVGRCLSAKISCSAKLLELALFKISKGYSIDCILEYTQCKLEHAITKINFLLEKCKIPEDVANYLIEKISSIIEDIEAIKNN